MPSRAAAPGARFWTTTSAFSSTRRSSTSAAAGCFTSSVRLSLERLVQTKWEARPRTRESYPRAKSPTPGRSILITRAPRSASWRVANGAAIACSRVTTVRPLSGCMGRSFRGSAQRGSRVHREPALMVLGPQLDGLAVVLKLAVDAERVQVERRPDGLEAERRDVGLGQAAPHQVHQQRGDQRPVHDQSGIALDFGDVLAVVVDPVAVERERRVSEQQDVIGHDLALPSRPGLSVLGRRLDVAGALGVAVHDVVELDDG